MAHFYDCKKLDTPKLKIDVPKFDVPYRYWNDFRWDPPRPRDPDIKKTPDPKKPRRPIFPFWWLPDGGAKKSSYKLGGGMYAALLIRPITDLQIFSTDQTQFLPQLQNENPIVPSTPKPSAELPTETENPLIQEPIGFVDKDTPRIISNQQTSTPYNPQSYMPKESLGEMKLPEQPQQELPPKPKYAINSGMTTNEAWALAFGRRGEDQLGIQTNAGRDVFPTINTSKASSNSIKNFMTLDTPKQNVNKASLKKIMNRGYY